VEKPRLTIAVVMQRRASNSRWVDHIWEPWSVLSGYEGESAPRKLVEEPNASQFLHPGFELALHKDEAEGYYFNVSSANPSVFVLWRMEGEQGLPVQVTASVNEAQRWLDGGHSIDKVAMPPEIYAWLGAYVEANYRPEPPTKKIKPRSFLHPKDRV
jgi:hypothetical protein